MSTALRIRYGVNGPVGPLEPPRETPPIVIMPAPPNLVNEARNEARELARELASWERRPSVGEALINHPAGLQDIYNWLSHYNTATGHPALVEAVNKLTSLVTPTQQRGQERRLPAQNASTGGNTSAPLGSSLMNSIAVRLSLGENIYNNGALAQLPPSASSTTSGRTATNMSNLPTPPPPPPMTPQIAQQLLQLALEGEHSPFTPKYIPQPLPPSTSATEGQTTTTNTGSGSTTLGAPRRIIFPL